jgi:hypothetical protein
MKLLRVGVLAFAVIGCSTNPPTSPSAGDPSLASIRSSIATASVGRDVQKTTVHFYSDDDELGGNIHIAGLPVTITGQFSGTVVADETGRQGSVTVWLPSTDTSATVATEQWHGFCPVTVQLPLPLHGNVDSWILIHQACP